MQGIVGIYLLYFDIILFHLQTEVKYRTGSRNLNTARWYFIMHKHKKIQHKERNCQEDRHSSLLAFKLLFKDYHIRRSAPSSVNNGLEDSRELCLFS